MAESYKLLKEFPGSPEKNSIAILDSDDESLFEIYDSNGNCMDEFINRDYIDNYPDYWELLIPHKEESFIRTIKISFSEKEYSLMMSLVKLAVEENIIGVYRDAKKFFEDFEKNNYVAQDVTLKIPIAYIKVMANAVGVVAYSHQKISAKKRYQLKKILTKIESHYDYINRKEKRSFNFIDKLINFIKKLK
jgi:hypothetical protein